MKKLLVIGLTLVSFKSFAWFNVQANCRLVSGAVARCVVANNYGRPMYCQIGASGQTAYGYWMEGYGEGVVQPGMFMYAEVYANNPYTDPLVSASAGAQCQW